jgi:hypothetical protein
MEDLSPSNTWRYTMQETRTRIRYGAKVAEQPLSGLENEAYLVAALAATLVEYRRYVKHRNGKSESEATGHNWRIVSRLEQLQG